MADSWMRCCDNQVVKNGTAIRVFRTVYNVYNEAVAGWGLRVDGVTSNTAPTREFPTPSAH